MGGLLGYDILQVEPNPIIFGLLNFFVFIFPPRYSPFEPPMGIQFTYEIPIKMLIKVLLNLYMQNLWNVLDQFLFSQSP